MLKTTKRGIATMTAAACLGSAGWALAAGSNSSSSVASSASATQSAIAASATTPPQGQPPPQTQVTGDAAAKIKAAVLAKVPGATIDRVEQGRTATTPTSPSRTARGRPRGSTRSLR